MILRVVFKMAHPDGTHIDFVFMQDTPAPKTRKQIIELAIKIRHLIQNHVTVLSWHELEDD